MTKRNDPPATDDRLTVPPDEFALLVENPEGERPYGDGTIQDPEALSGDIAGFAALTPAPDQPDAPVSMGDQFQFLRDAHDGPPVWRGYCLRLARMAPRLPAVHPSAVAAQQATPRRNRVHDIQDLRRGMVAYFDDPNDSNPYGHIVTVAGWVNQEPTDSLDDLLCWSNDAARTGGVDLVRASFFPAAWGDEFQFGATSLNGYDLPGYQAGVRRHALIGDALDQAIRDIRAAMREHRAAGHTRLVNALARDLAELKQTRARFS